jgi:hypothetical protein
MVASKSVMYESVRVMRECQVVLNAPHAARCWFRNCFTASCIAVSSARASRTSSLMSEMSGNSVMRLLGGGEIDVEGLGLEMETVKGDAGEVKDEGDPPLFLFLRFFLLVATGLLGEMAAWVVSGRATSGWTSLRAVGEDGLETRPHCGALISSESAVFSTSCSTWREDGDVAVSVREVLTVTLALWSVETDSQSLS